MILSFRCTRIEVNSLPVLVLHVVMQALVVDVISEFELPSISRPWSEIKNLGVIDTVTSMCFTPKFLPRPTRVESTHPLLTSWICSEFNCRKIRFLWTSALGNYGSTIFLDCGLNDCCCALARAGIVLTASELVERTENSSGDRSKLIR